MFDAVARDTRGGHVAGVAPRSLSHGGRRQGLPPYGAGQTRRQDRHHPAGGSARTRGDPRRRDLPCDWRSRRARAASGRLAGDRGGALDRVDRTPRPDWRGGRGGRHPAAQGRAHRGGAGRPRPESGRRQVVCAPRGTTRTPARRISRRWRHRGRGARAADDRRSSRRDGAEAPRKLASASGVVRTGARSLRAVLVGGVDARLCRPGQLRRRQRLHGFAGHDATVDGIAGAQHLLGPVARRRNGRHARRAVARATRGSRRRHDHSGPRNRDARRSARQRSCRRRRAADRLGPLCRDSPSRTPTAVPRAISPLRPPFHRRQPLVPRPRARATLSPPGWRQRPPAIVAGCWRTTCARRSPA